MLVSRQWLFPHVSQTMAGDTPVRPGTRVLFLAGHSLGPHNPKPYTAGGQGVAFVTRAAALDFQVSLRVSIVFKMTYVQLLKKVTKYKCPC